MDAKCSHWRRLEKQGFQGVRQGALDSGWSAMRLRLGT